MSRSGRSQIQHSELSKRSDLGVELAQHLSVCMIILPPAPLAWISQVYGTLTVGGQLDRDVEGPDPGARPPVYDSILQCQTTFAGVKLRELKNFQRLTIAAKKVQVCWSRSKVPVDFYWLKILSSKKNSLERRGFWSSCRSSRRSRST